jgi:hypothetical protein
MNPEQTIVIDILSSCLINSKIRIDFRFPSLPLLVMLRNAIFQPISRSQLLPLATDIARKLK